jgi:hypothetical protein
MSRSNTLLDASKTGLRLRREVHLRDEKSYRGRPYCMDPQHHKLDRSDCHPNGPRVLEKLQQAGERLSDNLLKNFDETVPEHHRHKLPQDVDLLRPINKLETQPLTRDQEQELAAVKKHVDAAFVRFKDIVVKKDRQVPAALKSPTKNYKKRGDGAFRKQDDMLAVSVFYHSLELKSQDIRNIEVEKIMASYAYRLNENFGFSVAFRTLCIIKASASPKGIAPSTRPFDELRNMSSSAGRFLRAAVLSEDTQ